MLGVLVPNGILPRAKFTLHAILAFSYIGSITARHSISGRQLHCGVVSSLDRAAIPFDIGRSNCLVIIVMVSNVAARMDDGKLFHVRGAATGNAQRDN